MEAARRPGNPDEVDEATLSQARAGERKALEALLEEVQPQIYRFGLRMCRHPQDAEDILQETMLTIARSLESYRGEGQFSTWAYSIARSYCIKKRRRRVGEPTPSELAALDVATTESRPADQLQAIENQQTWSRVAAGLLQLSDENREVLVLRDVEGLSAQEAADVLGIGVTALKSRLHRARKQLRSELYRTEATENCPDIATAFSQQLEGELSPASCAEMERHIEHCPACKGICDSLKTDLQLCRSAPRLLVPPEVQERIRRAVERMPRYKPQL